MQQSNAENPAWMAIDVGPEKWRAGRWSMGFVELLPRLRYHVNKFKSKRFEGKGQARFPATRSAIFPRVWC